MADAVAVDDGAVTVDDDDGAVWNVAIAHEFFELYVVGGDDFSAPVAEERKGEPTLSRPNGESEVAVGGDSEHLGAEQADLIQSGT